MNMQHISDADPAIANLIDQELYRQRNRIELIASENFVSPAVMQAMGSCLTNKYAEGLPNKRYYSGCEVVDEIEQIAINRVCELFGSECANVQPHSGASANMAVYLSVLKPGDTILGMNLSHGGHLTHGSPVSITGKYFNTAHYGVNPDDERIDYDEVLRVAEETKPQIIVAGASAYARTIDFAKFREIADAVGAYLLVDMAHIAGLVAAGEHPSPIPHAHFVTSTTHKTLRGPRGGIILCPEEHIKKINSAVFPGLQGGPLMHVIAGKAVCFGEALQPTFKEYAHNIILNANTMGEVLAQEGLRLVSDGTNTHLVLVDVSVLDKTGKEVEEMLESAHITCNKNTIPFEKNGANVTSGIRLGTPAVTTRGMNQDDMKLIATSIAKIAKEGNSAIKGVREQMEGLCEKYPLYPGM